MEKFSFERSRDAVWRGITDMAHDWTQCDEPYAF